MTNDKSFLNIKHPQQHQILNVNNADRPIKFVNNWKFIDSKLAHDGNRFAGQMLAADALRVASHDAGDALPEGRAIVIRNHPAKIAIGAQTIETREDLLGGTAERCYAL